MNVNLIADKQVTIMAGVVYVCIAYSCAPCVVPLTPIHQTFICLTHLTHHLPLYKMLHHLEQLSSHTIKHYFSLIHTCSYRLGKGDRDNITLVGDQLTASTRTTSPLTTYIHPCHTVQASLFTLQIVTIARPTI